MSPELPTATPLTELRLVTSKTRLCQCRYNSDSGTLFHFVIFTDFILMLSWVKILQIPLNISSPTLEKLRSSKRQPEISHHLPRISEKASIEPPVEELGSSDEHEYKRGGERTRKQCFSRGRFRSFRHSQKHYDCLL